MGGLSLTFIPEKKSNPFFLKLLTSAFRSDENEGISISGDYSLGQLDTDLGSNTFGETLNELGSGTQQQFVRNFLDIQVYNAELRGGLEVSKRTAEVSKAHFLQWSLKAQHERVDDFINEWERLDSAGYSLPFDRTEGAVELFSVLKTENQLQSTRFSGFLQDTWTWRKEDVADIRLSAGVRGTYWDLNQELVISPRAQLLYKPLGGTADISYKIAGGLYAQPPFYREMRGPDGTVNTDLKSQKSAHLVGGITSDFLLRKTQSQEIPLHRRSLLQKAVGPGELRDRERPHPVFWPERCYGLRGRAGPAAERGVCARCRVVAEPEPATGP